MAGRERKDMEEDEEDEEEEDEEEEEEDEEEEEEPMARAAMGQSMRKGQDEDDSFEYQRQQQMQMQMAAQKQMLQQQQQQQLAAQQAGGQGGRERKLANDTHDEAHDLDDDDDDEEEVETPTKAPTAAAFRQEFASKQLQNDTHDEAYDVGDDDHHVSTPTAVTGSRAAAPTGARLANAHHDEAYDIGDDGDEVSSDEEAANSNARQVAMQQQMYSNAMQRSAKSQEEEESSSDEEDSLRASAVPLQNEYNPLEYQNLNVTKDVKELFQFILQYKPHTIDLETKLKPFIPDYIPAVGDIDTFVKIPRPDNRPDNLGLTVLDEPASTQSNPAVVKMGLSYGSKKKAPSVFVESIEDARNRPTLVDKWISDIGNLHKKKPAPTVHYTKEQPDVETLLQVWPAEFEDLLSSAITLPPAKMNVELYQYVKIICCLLDIPVYTNLIESLHVLFTLYTEFKANQHFQNGPEVTPD